MGQLAEYFVQLWALTVKERPQNIGLEKAEDH